MPGPTTLAAQAPSRYLAPADTIFYAVSNRSRMYLVRAGDTVSAPTPLYQRTIEAQRWRRDQDGDLTVYLTSLSLDVYRQVVHDTFRIMATGAVRSINGGEPGLESRADLLPRLPGGVLAPWTTWRDSLDHTATGPGGSHWLVIGRTYRVDRWVDTLGRRAVQIQATGTAAYRDGWWADSAAGTYSWIEVTGPFSETALLDTDHGILLARRRQMDLTGTGGPAGPGIRPDTMPAGLRSVESEQWIVAADAHLRGRPLPGADTTLTIADVPELLHTVAHGDDSVASSLCRNDGTVGTARLRFAHDRPAEYRALWTDSAGGVRAVSAVMGSSGLAVSHLGGRDTTLAPPDSIWGIADQDMEELLVPSFLALPTGGAPLAIAVYRPLEGRWDRGEVLVRDLSGVRGVTLRLGQAPPEYLLVTADGDLLLAEVAGQPGRERLPRRGSARRERLDSLLSTLGSTGARHS